MSKPYRHGRESKSSRRDRAARRGPGPMQLHVWLALHRKHRAAACRTDLSPAEFKHLRHIGWLLANTVEPIRPEKTT